MKHRRLRPLGAWLLALSLILSLTAPALAADELTVKVEITSGTDGSVSVTQDSVVLDFKGGSATAKVVSIQGPNGQVEVANQEEVTCTVTGRDGVVKVEKDATDVNERTFTLTGEANGTTEITFKAEDDQGRTGSLTYRVIVKGAQTNAPPVPVESIALSDDDGAVGAALSLNTGDMRALTATVSPTYATNVAVTWTSSDPAVVYVDGIGRLTALKAGSATVTAAANDSSGVNAQVAVTVSDILVNSLRLKLAGEDDSTAVASGKSEIPFNSGFQLAAVIDPANATDSSVTWRSSNPAVAEVSDAGQVVSRAAGTVTITATANDAGKKTASWTVTVLPPVAVTGVKLTLPLLRLNVGAESKLEYTVSPGDAANKNVSWSSDNPAVATVAAGGVVTGVAAGTAKITVTTEDGGYTDACNVTVIIPDVEAINLPAGPIYLGQGQSLDMDYTLAPNSAQGTVSWDSSNRKIATVDQNGRVQAQTGTAGETVITASCGEVTAECTVVVEGIVLEQKDVPLMLGRSQILTYKSYTQDTKNTPAVTWRSDDPAVAAISKDGRVTGRKEGTTTITLTYVVGKQSYKDTCAVTVSEDAASIVAPAGAVDAGAPYMFSDILTDLNKVCQERTERALSYITNVSVPTSVGILYYNHVSNDDTGFGVGVTERYYRIARSGERVLEGLTFVPNPDFSGIAVISYTGYNDRNEAYNGTVRLMVEASGDVTYITTAGKPVTFQTAQFSAACRAQSGRELSWITFEPPASSRGTLYYGYTNANQFLAKTTRTDQYYRSRSPYLDQVTFAPAEGYSGVLRIPYKAMDSGGGSYSAQVNIIVTGGGSAGVDGLTYTADQGNRVVFSVFDINDACQKAVGQNLDYIRFTALPPDTQGALYYNYYSSVSPGTLVSTSTRYYRNSTPMISSVSFVPVSADFAGTVSIPFVGYAASSAERFEGTVTINYRGDSGEGVIPYSISNGQFVHFESADFNELSIELTGKSLSSIRFNSLPSSGQGTLYYNYNANRNSGTQVTTTTSYSRSDLSKIAFVPVPGYSGTVSLDFTGYDTDGSRFHGTVRIQVEMSNSTLYYSVRSGGSLAFNAGEFNTICQRATGSNLNYVRFDLPASGTGSLYYRYGKTNQTGVSASGNYYRATGSTRLEDVSFVPASGYTGTVTVTFTGYGENGVRFAGKAEIRVYQPTASAILYSGSSVPVSLRASDFNNACAAQLSQRLNYVQFTGLPTAASGRLYSGYTGYGTGSEVTSADRYYYSGTPGLDQLSFVPRADFSGSVNISYVGVDLGGERVSGTVSITVAPTTYTHFSDVAGNYSWAAPSVEYLYRSGVVRGISDTEYGPSMNILRCDFVLMLSRAFGFSGGGGSGFSDVPADSYYAHAVSAARAEGIVTGDGVSFRPRDALTRQDAMVMLWRAMHAAGRSVPAGSTADLSGFTDSGQVSAYAREAVGAMVLMGVVKGNDLRQLQPTSPITRAEMAAILHRAMTM